MIKVASLGMRFMEMVHLLLANEPDPTFPWTPMPFRTTGLVQIFRL
jgi:hypothetical protein